MRDQFSRILQFSRKIVSAKVVLFLYIQNPYKIWQDWHQQKESHAKINLAKINLLKVFATFRCKKYHKQLRSGKSFLVKLKVSSFWLTWNFTKRGTSSKIFFKDVFLVFKNTVFRKTSQCLFSKYLTYLTHQALCLGLLRPYLR